MAQSSYEAEELWESAHGLGWERARGYWTQQPLLCKTVDIWLYSWASIKRVLCRTIMLVAIVIFIGWISSLCTLLTVAFLNVMLKRIFWDEPSGRSKCWIQKYFFGSRIQCRCQSKTMDSGSFPTFIPFAMVTVPAPAPSTVQEMILHDSTVSSDQKVWMKKNEAEKRLVHCGGSIAFISFFFFSWNVAGFWRARWHFLVSGLFVRLNWWQWQAALTHFSSQFALLILQ